MVPSEPNVLATQPAQNQPVAQKTQSSLTSSAQQAHTTQFKNL